jgi:hydroxymethylpyrimidine/phosphomethylpyrimidine kinase
MKNPPVALTIAGSDSCAGAGIQADLKTFSAFGVYGVCALTAVTAQNTTGIQAIHGLSAEVVRQQLASIFADLKVGAAKTGMLDNAAVVRLVAEAVSEYKIARLVVDPVLWAKDGSELLSPEALDGLKNQLLPLAYLTTPNLAEAQALCGFELDSPDSIRQAAKVIRQQGAQKVLITGGPGDAGDEVCDVFYDGRGYEVYRHPRLSGTEWHGTGCTLSAAIAAGLALRHTVKQAVRDALEYVQVTIRHSRQLGCGYKLLNHMAKGES